MTLRELVGSGDKIIGYTLPVLIVAVVLAVSLLVLPSIGFLLDTWTLAVVGIVMYLVARRFAPEEEAGLAETFGPRWDEYRADVMIPWL